MRPPKGFSADTPHIDAIKLRHFFAHGRGQREEASAEGPRRRSRRRLSRSAAVDGMVAHRSRRAWPIERARHPLPPDPDRRSAGRRRSTVRAVDEHGEARDTPIAGEHPLTLYVDKREILTLMTLGAAPEALAIGYLRNQRLLDSHRRDRLGSGRLGRQRGGRQHTRMACKDLDAKLGKRTTTSGCGQGTVFGDLMEEIDYGAASAPTRCSPRATLYALLDRVRGHETIYKQAGAVHGCALASNDDGASEILYFVEDVGRHNAVDAIAGLMWLDRVDGGDKIFYTTGRLTSEMVIKAAQMGIPFLGLALGTDADGLRDRAEGRHHHDRPRRPASTSCCSPAASGFGRTRDPVVPARGHASGVAACSPAARAGAWAASTRAWCLLAGPTDGAARARALRAAGRRAS